MVCAEGELCKATELTSTLPLTLGICCKVFPSPIPLFLPIDRSNSGGRGASSVTTVRGDDLRFNFASCEFRAHRCHRRRRVVDADPSRDHFERLEEKSVAANYCLRTSIGTRHVRGALNDGGRLRTRTAGSAEGSRRTRLRRVFTVYKRKAGYRYKRQSEN